MAIRTEYQLDEREVHEVLSNERRAQTLEALKEEPEEVDLRTLAQWVAEAETGESPPPKNIRNSVYNSLHQTHLPKLDELDVVDYDEDRKTVSLRPEARTVDLYMEVLTPYGITWSTYYRTMGVLALLTVIGSYAGLPPMVGDGVTVLIASVFLVIIALSTAYQLWSNQWIQLRGLLEE